MNRFEELQHYLDQGFSFVFSGNIVTAYSEASFIHCVELYCGTNIEHAFLACEGWKLNNAAE